MKTKHMKTKHKVTIIVTVITVIGGIFTTLISKDWGNPSTNSMNSSSLIGSTASSLSKSSGSVDDPIDANTTEQENETAVNNITPQGNGITNNIFQNGDGHNEVNIYPNSIKTSKENWQIDLLNDINNTIEIGSDLILDFAINTPPSQFSTPYVLYGAYYSNKNWVQFHSMKIPAGQSHIKLSIDTYKLGIKGTYFFSFDLFRSEDYSEGNSCASYFNEFFLTGDNAPYSGSDDVFYRGVTKYELLDYFTIKDQKYSLDTESLILSDVNDVDIKSIAYLSNLKDLSIIGSNITNIKPLMNLKKLKSLSVHSNQLYDISPFEKMQSLESLSIGGENHSGMGNHGVLEDISPIQSLTKLKSLTIYDCNVENIEYVGNLKLLEYVDIHKTNVKNISPLGQLHFVKILKLHTNNINDVTILYNLTNLSHVTLSNNNLTNEQIDNLRKQLPNCDVFVS